MKYILLLLLLFALTSLTYGQEIPKYEFFTGFSILSNNGTAEGATLALNRNVNNFLGIKMDLSGYRDGKTITIQNSPLSSTTKIRATNFSVLLGPQVAYRKHKTYTPYGHLLLGAGRVEASTTTTFQNPDPTFDPFPQQKISIKDTGFAIALGGGLDIRLNEKFSFRAVQIDLYNASDSAARISTGIVIKFGK